MSASLVGSEMCIRDRVVGREASPLQCTAGHPLRPRPGVLKVDEMEGPRVCLLYTSDAADDM
eukprot:4886549-Alexandrium_andersonii.AAC.1